MSDIISKRKLIEHLKDFFGDEENESWNSSKIIDIIKEETPITESKAVETVFDSIKNDLIREVNSLQTYKMFAGGDKLVELDRVLEILEKI